MAGGGGRRERIPDPVRFFIGGDSAGANLALGACLRLRAAGRPAPGGMLLNYGAYDMTLRPSHERFDGPDYMLTTREMRGILGGSTWGPGKLRRRRRRGHCWRSLARTAARVSLHSGVRHPGGRESGIGCPAGRRRGSSHRAHLSGRTHGFLEAVEVSKLAGRALDEGAGWMAGLLDGGV